MLTVLFRLKGESARNSIAVPDEDTLLNVCHALEHSDVVKHYTIIDPENSEPGTESVSAFGWSSSNFDKYVSFQEF